MELNPEVQAKLDQIARKLIEVEKLATIGRLATAMAHEIRQYARKVKGMRTLREEGLVKCINGITSTEEKVTFICTCAATHTTVHEDLQRSEFFQTLSKSFEDDLLPVFRKFPVVFIR